MMFDHLFEDGGDIDWRYPTAVLELPVRFRDPRNVEIVRQLPLLLVRDNDGGITVPDEVTSWVRDQLIGTQRKVLREGVATIARLAAFHIMTGRPAIEGPKQFDALVDSYLLLRLASPHDVGLRPFPLWNPISGDTARRELQSLDSFVQHCKQVFGPLSFMSEALRAENGVFGQRLPKRYNSKHFSHLDDQWSNYQSLRKQSAVLSPHLRLLARSVPKVLAGDGRVMVQEEADRIIDCTDNPTYKSLFAAMAGLGRRTSEYLHLFRCDYLPPERVAQFMDYQNGQPLLAFCHPSRSTYLGRPGDERRGKNATNREAYLKEMGLEPRHLTISKSYHSGWKGMVFYHRAFVTIPPWIDDRYREIFEEGLSDMRHAIEIEGKGRQHPYMFVYSTPGDSRGSPVKWSQVQRAFDRAVAKAGLSGLSHIHLHGFRHFYVSFLRRELGLDREQVMLTMGHSSIHSQDDYGLKLRTIFQTAQQRQEYRNAA